MFYDESYYDQEREQRRAVLFGWWGVGAYLALVAVAWLFLTVSLSEKDQSIVSEGVMVAFGDVTEARAAGAEVNQSDAISSDYSIEEPSSEDVLTQDYEDAPAMVSKPETKPSPKPEEQRKPNPSALFPGSGRAQGGNNGAVSGASQGAINGSGQQGSLSGAVEGNPVGMGQGAEGTVGGELAGRGLKEALPLPRYNSNKQGRVVVDITVNEMGRVTRATPALKGNTTTDSELISEALAAARRAQFNLADNVQTGTITYNFYIQN